MTATYGISSWVSGLLFCHVSVHCAETWSCSWAVSLSVSGEQQELRLVFVAKTCWMFTSVYKGWTRGRAAGITVWILASLWWRHKTFSTQSGGHCAIHVAHSKIKKKHKQKKTKFLVIAPLAFFSWTVPGLFWTQLAPLKITKVIVEHLPRLCTAECCGFSHLNKTAQIAPQNKGVIYAHPQNERKSAHAKLLPD